MVFPYKWPVFADAAEFHKNLLNKQHLASYCLLSGPRPGTSLGLQLGLSQAPPSTAYVAQPPADHSVAHAGWSQQGREEVLLGGPRANTPSGQLQTTPDYNLTSSTSDTFKGQAWWSPKPY